MSVGGDIAPLRDFGPAVGLPVREIEQLAILGAVAVGVDQLVSTQVVSLFHPAHLFSAAAVTAEICAGEYAVALLQRRADAREAAPFAPWREIDVERSRHDDHVVAARAMPVDPLERDRPYFVGKDSRGVVDAEPADCSGVLTRERYSCRDTPAGARRQQSEAISDD